MKKLLLGLFFCVSAHADTIATVANKAGGMLILTDAVCKNDLGYYAYSTNPSATTQFGCWWTDETMVHIVWLADNDIRSYPIVSFNINIEKASKLKKRNKETY